MVLGAPEGVALMALSHPRDGLPAVKVAPTATTIGLATGGLWMLFVGVQRSLPDLPRPRIVDWGETIMQGFMLAWMASTVVGAIVYPEAIEDVPPPFNFLFL